MPARIVFGVCVKSLSCALAPVLKSIASPGTRAGSILGQQAHGAFHSNENGHMNSHSQF